MTWVVVGISAATAAYGIYQSVEGDKKAKKATAALKAETAKDPIPQAQKERLQRLKGREQTEMPGLSTIKEDIGASTSKGLSSFKEMGNQANFQDFIAQSIQHEQDQYANLGIEAARYKLDRSKDVDAALSQSASYQDQQRQDKLGLYAADLASGEAKKGAGTQNIIQGSTTAASSLAGGVGSEDTYSQYKAQGGTLSRKEWRSMKNSSSY